MTPILDTLPDAAPDTALLDERGLSKLRWRCRRGLLENDLFIDRFFSRHDGRITVGQAHALDALMDLSDNDLLDLLLRRKEPEGELATVPVSDLLVSMRVDPRPSFPLSNSERKLK